MTARTDYVGLLYCAASDAGPSKSGKTILIATTEGNAAAWTSRSVADKKS